MDFDHVRGNKKFDLSNAYRKATSVKDLERELAKCDLICANCHRDRTQSRIISSRIATSDIIIPNVAPDSPDKSWYAINKARICALIKIRRIEINQFIRSLKDNGFCIDCKQSHPYWRLDFDHRENKIINISTITRKKHWGRERILEEIAKCDLVCANCHRFRTHKRKSAENELMVA
jgi:hypothetical protein